MKKKIVLCLLLFVLAIPCLILVGCGQEKEFKYDFTDADGMHFVLPGSYNAAAGGFESGNGYVKKGESVKYDLILSNAYDASTLKIYNNGKEVSSANYTVTYSNNVNAGSNATVKVTGKGNYSGEKTATFTIAKRTLRVTPTAGQSKIYG